MTLSWFNVLRWWHFWINTALYNEQSECSMMLKFQVRDSGVNGWCFFSLSHRFPVISFFFLPTFKEKSISLLNMLWFFFFIISTWLIFKCIWDTDNIDNEISTSYNLLNVEIDQLLNPTIACFWSKNAQIQCCDVYNHNTGTRIC